MSAQGEDILAWLDNAISVREAAASAATVPYGGHWVQGFPEQHKDPALRYGWDADMVHLSQTDPHIAYQCLSGEIAALTVLHDPESVLRRCAADRKLLAAYEKANGPQSLHTDDPRINGHREGAKYALLQAVRALAEGYGWTGGER